MTRGRRVWIGAILAATGVLSTALFSVRSGAELGKAGRLPGSPRGALEPLTAVAAAELGGVVAEVCARPGESVKRGQVLVRFKQVELRERVEELRHAVNAAESAREARRALDRVPDRVKRYLYETDPEVVTAEQAYIEALQNYERTGPRDRAAAEARLAEASRVRVQVRRRLDAALSGNAGVALAIASVRRSLADAERLLQSTEARAPVDGVVDILDLRPGDRVLPRGAVAVLVRPLEYSAEFVLSPELAERVATGAELGATVEGREFRARVESVTKRMPSVAFREQTQMKEETVVRARLDAQQSFRPGTAVEFRLP